jgi:hypothetical protein
MTSLSNVKLSQKFLCCGIHLIQLIINDAIMNMMKERLNDIAVVLRKPEFRSIMAR